jgi:hypothetical protein
MEAIIQKSEQIVGRTADGVRKGVVPQQVVPLSELRLIDAALVDAKIEVFEPGVRKNLADLVALREEEELVQARLLHAAQAASSEELRRPERSLAEARPVWQLGADVAWQCALHFPFQRFFQSHCSQQRGRPAPTESPRA